MLRLILFACMTISIQQQLVSTALPGVIRKCSRSDENIDDCICKSIELLRKNLADGDFGENFTIPPIEPLYLPEVFIRRQNSEMIFSNLYVSGPSKFVLKNMKANVMNTTFNFDLDFDLLDFKGDYSIAFFLNSLIKLSGTGKFVGSFKNSLAKIKATGEITDEGFTKFLLTVKLLVEHASFQMESLLSGFGVNKFINDNYKMFLDELVPGLEASLSRQFSDIINFILKDSKYVEIFPM